MEINRFKEELKDRVTDFAVSHYLIGLSETKSSKVKKQQAEDAYKKLEEWVVDQINEGMVTVADHLPSGYSDLYKMEIPESVSEDQQDLGF